MQSKAFEKPKATEKRESILNRNIKTQFNLIGIRSTLAQNSRTVFFKYFWTFSTFLYFSWNAQKLLGLLYSLCDAKTLVSAFSSQL